MSSNFPCWAPVKLTEHYDRHFKGDVNHGYVYKLERPMLYRLITDNRMEKIWKALLKTRSHTILDNYGQSDKASQDMCFFVFKALSHALVESQKKVITREQEALKNQKIAKAARDLIRAIKDTELDKSPFNWYPIEAINTIIQKDIKPEKLSGSFSLIEDKDEFHKKGGIYSPVSFTNLSGEKVTEHWRVAESTKHYFTRSIITPSYPVISSVIGGLALEADSLAKKAMHKHKVAERPKIRANTVFIRHLYGSYWHNEFGSPLYRTMGTLCSIALDDSSIGESTIKDALKNYTLPRDC